MNQSIETHFLNNYADVLKRILQNLWKSENISIENSKIISLSAPDVILFINDFFSKLNEIQDDSSYFSIKSSFLDTVSLVITENI